MSGKALIHFSGRGINIGLAAGISYNSFVVHIGLIFWVLEIEFTKKSEVNHEQ